VSYEVRLDVFEGPLDLLLQLVSKEQVDITEITISEITNEYLQAVRRMGDLDLEMASSFLVLAATLLELKSMRLLPRGSSNDPEVAALLEERDHLLHRLIEYSTFKEAAADILSRLDANAGYHYRTGGLPEEVVTKLPDFLSGVSADNIAEAASAAMTPRATQPVDTSFMTPIRVSVREMIDVLAGELRSHARASFRDLCRSASSRIEIIVRFLALLELFRVQSVDLEQDEPFGPITVRWREPKLGSSK
jgi:segregation and condensation protein A